jgi:hypothetical protein
MNTVSVRPRLDLRYDVIQSVFPQLVGVRDTKGDAIVLAEWAAKRIAPARLTVFGPDGATPEEVRDVEPDPSRPPRAAAAGAH